VGHAYEAKLNTASAAVVEATREGNTRELLAQYETLLKLQSFRDLNASGFRKIVKKADRTYGTHEQEAFLAELRTRRWVSGNELEGIVQAIEEMCNPHALLTVRQRVDRSALPPEARPFSVRAIACSLLLGLAVFALPLFSSERGLEQRCLALIVTVISLWLSKAIPYYATSLFVPVLAVVLGILGLLASFSSPSLSSTSDPRSQSQRLL
jgi:phosphate transporter